METIICHFGCVLRFLSVLFTLFYIKIRYSFRKIEFYTRQACQNRFDFFVINFGAISQT